MLKNTDQNEAHEPIRKRIRTRIINNQYNNRKHITNEYNQR